MRQHRQLSRLNQGNQGVEDVAVPRLYWYSPCKHPVHMHNFGNRAEKRITLFVGTRPELIKLAPLILALRANENLLNTRVVFTGQHRELLREQAKMFWITPDKNLDVMTENQSLNSLSSSLLCMMESEFEAFRPDLVIAQGDTTTTMVASLASFHQKIPFAHVEAGLRSGDLSTPFPEELNRKLAAQMASFHFAPTAGARENLLQEGISDDRIWVTGNTGIDTLLHATRSLLVPKAAKRDRPQILLTLHRRENHGAPMRSVFDAVCEITRAHPDVEFLFPVHPNPKVKTLAYEMLAARPQIKLVEPMGYLDFVEAMANSTLILSDSGGVQEEAPSLNVPVLILRSETERPEAVQCGSNKLVGTDKNEIVQTVSDLLTQPHKLDEMRWHENPYGDGNASERIVDVLKNKLSLNAAHSTSYLRREHSHQTMSEAI